VVVKIRSGISGGVYQSSRTDQPHLLCDRLGTLVPKPRATPSAAAPSRRHNRGRDQDDPYTDRAASSASVPAWAVAAYSMAKQRQRQLRGQQHLHREATPATPSVPPRPRTRTPEDGTFSRTYTESGRPARDPLGHLRRHLLQGGARERFDHQQRHRLDDRHQRCAGHRGRQPWSSKTATFSSTYTESGLLIGLTAGISGGRLLDGQTSESRVYSDKFTAT